VIDAGLALPLGQALALERERSIRGRVVDKESKPVVDAIVVAAYKETESYPYEIRISSRVRTKEDGSFVLGPLERKSFWLLALKEGVGVGFVPDKSPGAWVEVVLAPGATVSGTITELDTGKPLVGATVGVTDWSFWSETKSDEKGKYTLNLLPPTVNLWSGHRVLAMAPGFRRAERNNLILKSEAEETINFALEKGDSLTGKILDAQTLRPIEGAVVAEGWESYHQTTQSDKEGAFDLAHVHTNPNRMFTVRADGYLPQQRQSDGTGSLEFKLSRSETLEGTVLNLKDEPVAGARVYLHRLKYAPGHQQQGSGSGRWRQVAVSDAEGKFHFTEVLPGQVAVVAFDKEFAPGEYGPIEIQLGAPPPQGIKVNLREGVTVQGEVRDTNDEPIPSIQVSLQRWQYRAKGYKWATTYMWSEQPTWYTDAKGKFTLKGAIPGQLYLSVWDRTYGWTAQQVKGEEGQRIDGLILSFAGESIEGVFLDADGQPVPGASVYAQGPINTQRQAWRWTNTDALGRFKLAGLKSGDYNINGSLHNNQAEPAKAIPAGTTGVELKLKSTSVVVGEVTSVLSGRALNEYQLQFTAQKDPNNRNRRGSNWSGQVKSPDGKFERPIKPGIYTAVVKARGHAPTIVRDIVVEENVPPQPLFIRLDQGGGIKGVIRDVDGKPLRGVWIRANVQRAAGEKRQQWDGMMGGNDGTDSEGRYFIEGVAPGSYRLDVNMGNRGSASAVVSVSGSESVQQDLQLIPGGYVVFKVTDEEDKPLQNVYFQIRDENGGWVGWSRNTNAQGSSRTGQLRPGPAIVTAIRNGYVQEKINVMIQSTKTITVNVQMRKIKAANK